MRLSSIEKSRRTSFALVYELTEMISSAQIKTKDRTCGSFFLELQNKAVRGGVHNRLDSLMENQSVYLDWSGEGAGQGRFEILSLYRAGN